MNKTLYTHRVIICIGLAIATSHRVIPMDKLMQTVHELKQHTYSFMRQYPTIAACSGAVLATNLFNGKLAYQQGAHYLLQNRLKTFPIAFMSTAASIYMHHRYATPQPPYEQVPKRTIIFDPYIPYVPHVITASLNFLLYPYILRAGSAGFSLCKRHPFAAAGLGLAAYFAANRLRNDNSKTKPGMPSDSGPTAHYYTGETSSSSGSTGCSSSVVILPPQSIKVGRTQGSDGRPMILVDIDGQLTCYTPSPNQPAPTHLPLYIQEQFGKIQRQILAEIQTPTKKSILAGEHQIYS